MPVTANAVNVPTDVMLVCAAVANVPVMFVPDRLPPVMLPTAVINPDATKLAPLTLARVFTLPVATTAPTVFMLPPMTLPATDTMPVASKLPDCTFPFIVSKFGPAVSNVKPAVAPALPALLNNTCVLEPGTTKLPVMLPAKLPTK